MSKRYMDWSWKNIERRVGRFKVSSGLLTRDTASIVAVLSKVLVVRCEHHFSENVFEYEALSPLFGEVPRGMVIPHYDIWIERNDERAGDADIGDSQITVFVPRDAIRISEDVA